MDNGNGSSGRQEKSAFCNEEADVVTKEEDEILLIALIGYETRLQEKEEKDKKLKEKNKGKTK